MNQIIDCEDLFLSRNPEIVSNLLEEWRWLLGHDATPFAASIAGDAFILDSDKIVYRLDCGTGQLNPLERSIDTFYTALIDRKAQDDWLLATFVGFLRRSGLVPQPGECYSYKVLPILGGKYDVQNMITVNATEHFGLTGEIHKQISKLPDGATVQRKIGP